ncbi:MAG: hypothetical protein AAF587_45155, partial [Bacteroidota bacterium]
MIQLAKALAKKNDTSEEAEMKKLTQKSKQRQKSPRLLKRSRTKPPTGLATTLSEMINGTEVIFEEQEDLVRA